jgi:uncharacterized protein YbgA (DUF1722 family)/uncharacterized protein YbbK (DUF523 family)
MTTQGAAIRIGISSCLLGKLVRFDGGHKHNEFLTSILGPYVEWVAVCPEVEIGMGTPREAVRLVGDPAAPRMVGGRSGTEHTRAMSEWARRRVRALDAQDLCGYVLKKDSPSCGMERVKVHPEAGGQAARTGVGLYAQALIAHAPLLPIEEEGRLGDARLRENWVERVFAYRRLKDLRAGRYRRGAVVEFHTAHKLQIMAHSPDHYRRLGRLVARIAQFPPAAFLDEYGARFMEALKVRATVGRNVNVLQHIAGYFTDRLEPAERAELAEVIADYRHGLVPQVVPVTLVRHHARRFAVDYVVGQTYLNPHPKELMLRNHV